MDRLDAMTLVLAAIEEGSLAAAARRHGRSAAAATRAVVLLEEAAGETLLLRSTRGLRPTAAGERHLAAWRDVLARLAEARDSPEEHVVAGTLVLTAPELFGRLKVMPVLCDFLEKHRKVEARVLLLNRMVDLVHEGIDVAVRLAPLPDTSLAAVKVGEVRRLLCASPAYLTAHDEPRKPADLSEHVCIGLNAEGDRELWPFRHAPGSIRERAVPVRTRLSVNSAAARLEAALHGRGLVSALSYQVAQDITEGRLVPILAAFEPDPVPVNIVFRAHPRPWSPTRAFVDHAVPRLRRTLAEIEARVGRARPAAPSAHHPSSEDG